MDQRSKEWYQARLGKVTASRLADVMARTKSGPGTSRKNYMVELALERIQGQPTETYQNAAMQRGIEKEPEARSEYEIVQGTLVTEIAFVDSNKFEMVGASPDGLVEQKGLVEIKCPNQATHLDFLLTGKIPEKYKWQMDLQMHCTERDWCDFVSFDDRFPGNGRIKIVRYKRDDSRQTLMATELEKFLKELNELEKQLKEICYGNARS